MVHMTGHLTLIHVIYHTDTIVQMTVQFTPIPVIAPRDNIVHLTGKITRTHVRSEDNTPELLSPLLISHSVF